MKLIAFDWDQTLWNSWDIHVQAAQYAAGVVELPCPPVPLIASTFSLPFARHMESLFNDKIREATNHYLEFYHSRVREMGCLFDGVPDMLRSLKSSGCLIAILSDKREVHGNRELNSTEIANLFDYVLFLDDSRAYKPNPTGLSQLIDALSADKDQTLYVGDSHVDVQCARMTGVASGAALWGSVNVEAVLEEVPEYLWHTVAELVATLIPQLESN